MEGQVLTWKISGVVKPLNELTTRELKKALKDAQTLYYRYHHRMCEMDKIVEDLRVLAAQYNLPVDEIADQVEMKNKRKLEFFQNERTIKSKIKGVKQ